MRRRGWLQFLADIWQSIWDFDSWFDRTNLHHRGERWGTFRWVLPVFQSTNPPYRSSRYSCIYSGCLLYQARTKQAEGMDTLNPLFHRFQQVNMDDEGTTFEQYLNHKQTTSLADRHPGDHSQLRIVWWRAQTCLRTYSIYRHILHTVIAAGHSTSCPEANLLPWSQHFKLNAVSHGSKSGDKVASADAAFTKECWGLQQSPNEEVFVNRLARFCMKWPQIGAYLDKHTKTGLAGQDCVGDCAIGTLWVFKRWVWRGCWQVCRHNPWFQQQWAQVRENMDPSSGKNN